MAEGADRIGQEFLPSTGKLHMELQNRKGYALLQRMPGWLGAGKIIKSTSVVTLGSDVPIFLLICLIYFLRNLWSLDQYPYHAADPYINPP